MGIKDLPLPLSRSDWFKYCIITEDIANLPTAHSREELFLKAFIDGDIDSLPEPLSKNDIYMYNTIMAITDDLPTLTSRSDKYWYAICTGLKDDIPEPLSRSDFYDYYLASNSAFRTWNTYDGTYIKVDNSRGGLAKDTVIKGATLQNLVVSELKTLGYSTYSKALYDISPKLKENGVYTVQFTLENPDGLSCSCALCNDDFSAWSSGSFVTTSSQGVFRGKKVISASDLNKASKLAFYYVASSQGIITAKVRNVILVEGDYTNIPLPEEVVGIESSGENDVVTATGGSKNLFNIPFSSKDDFKSDSYNYAYLTTKKTLQLKPFTNYTISAFHKDVTVNGAKVIAVGFGDIWVDVQQTTRILTRTDNVSQYPTNQRNSYTFMTDGSGLVNLWYYDNAREWTPYDWVDEIQIEEGTTATDYVPYEEPTIEYSNKVPLVVSGKNLFDMNNCNNITGILLSHPKENEVKDGKLYVYCNRNNLYGRGAIIKVKPNTQYTFSANVEFVGEEEGKKAMFYGQIFNMPSSSNKTIMLARSVGNIVSTTFTTPAKTHEIFVELAQTNCEYIIMSNVQLEEGTQTEYEPYIEPQIIEYNNVLLRGLRNGVTDTIDVDTGVLTKRIGVLVLNGSESDWFVYGVATKEGYSSFALPFAENKPYNGYCDTFNVGRYVTSLEEQCVMYPNGHLYVTLLSDRLPVNSVDGFKQWLKENPVTIYYESVNPVIEKVEPQQVKTYSNGTTLCTDTKIRASITSTLPIK